MKNNNNSLLVDATHILLCDGPWANANKLTDRCKSEKKTGDKINRPKCGLWPRVPSGILSSQLSRYTTAPFSFMLQFKFILKLLIFPGEDYRDLLIAFFFWTIAFSVQKNVTVFPVKRKFLECLLFRDQSDARWNRKRWPANRSRDQSRLDTKQRAGRFSSTRNLQYSLWIALKKLFFDHKPTPVTWFRLFKNQTTE